VTRNLDTHVKRIASGRCAVALHELRGGSGPALLALHALGGAAADLAPLATRWRGPVWGLDFSGHGASDHPRGGSYTPELFAADADAALAEIGEARLVGSGLGAYVALLVAGSRPTRVPAALLLPGRGFEGGGAQPDRATPVAERNARVLAMLDAERGAPFDPLATTCERDLRPPDYARTYADAAQRLLLAEPDVQPAWWEAARAAASSEAAPADAGAALARLRTG
jgi:pimeloyl-ACP methyl ester carboxylesterase